VRLLCLDLATKTGWATDTLSGMQDFSPRRGDSSGMRFIRFHAWLREMLSSVKPELVVYEQPILNQRKSGNAHAAEIAFGMAAILQTECESRGLQYCGINVAELKKFATGKGNAGKEAMHSALLARGVEACGWDDNQVDARWLLIYAKERL